MMVSRGAASLLATDQVDSTGTMARLDRLDPEHALAAEHAKILARRLRPSPHRHPTTDPTTLTPVRRSTNTVTDRRSPKRRDSTRAFKNPSTAHLMHCRPREVVVTIRSPIPGT